MTRDELIKLLTGLFEHRMELDTFMKCHVWPVYAEREEQAAQAAKLAAQQRREAEYERQRAASRERREAERQAKRTAKEAAKPPVRMNPHYTLIDGAPIPVDGPTGMLHVARQHIPVIDQRAGRHGHLHYAGRSPKTGNPLFDFKLQTNPASDAALEAHIQKYKNQT
jgi:hypothetical protein